MTSQPPARNQSVQAGSLSSGDFLYCCEKSTPQAASINNYSGRSIVLEAVCLSFFVTIKRLRGQEQRSMRTGRSDAPKPSLSVKTSAFVGTWVGEERLVFERRSVTRVRARPPLATVRPTQGSGCRVRANVGRDAGSTSRSPGRRLHPTPDPHTPAGAPALSASLSSTRSPSQTPSQTARIRHPPAQPPGEAPRGPRLQSVPT